MSISVRVNRKRKIKATVASGVIVARNLNDLLDVEVTDVKDKYIIMYDANTKKYVAIDPDVFLINAVEDQKSPGLPDQFIDELDKDLDDKIDLDGGTW
jgi:hypothetical protein